MRLVKKLPTLMLLTVLLLCNAAAALASAYVSISSPGGNGVFDLQGTGFDGVATVKVTITYDPATLVNPRVAVGGLMPGALVAANTNFPGTIILGLIAANTKPVSGSGSIASISFDLPGSSLGVIQSIRTDLGSAIGTRIDVQTSISNPSGSNTNTETTTSKDTNANTNTDNSDKDRSTDTNSGSGSGSGSGTGSGYQLVGGSLTMPDGGEIAKSAMEKPKGEITAEAAAEQKQAPAVPGTGDDGAARPSGETPIVASADKGEPAKSNNSTSKYQSVLEQFRSYQGPKTPQSLVAIFSQSAQQGFRQEPPVVLSDGSSKVTLVINLPSSGKDAPSFALADAQLVSLKMEGGSTWIVEALPSKGAYMATVRMLHDGVMTEIPLTVAPPLPEGAKNGKGGGLSEADFNLFLRGAGKAKAPLYDLNGDARRDYIDDYIFTANYIVASDWGKKVKAKEPK